MPEGNDQNKLVSALTDDNGNPSSGRYMAAGALLVATFLAVAPLFGTDPVEKDLILYFLIAAFGGKVGQKFAERP